MCWSVRICTFIVCLIICLASKGESIYVDNHFTYSLISGHAGHTCPFDISKIAYQDYFRRNKANIYGFDADEESRWIEIQVNNVTAKSQKLYLEVTNANIYHGRLYSIEQDVIILEHEFGIKFPMSHRPIIDANIILPIDVNPDVSKTFLMEIKASTNTNNFSLILWDHKARLDYTTKEITFFTVFQVIHIIFLVVLAIVLFITRQRWQWSLFIYVLLGAMYKYIDLGFGFRYIWPDHPHIQQIMPLVFIDFHSISAIFFIRRYFDIKSRSHLLDRLFLITAYACWSLILLRLIANYIAPSFVTILYFINDLLVLAIICLTISTVIFLLHIKNSIPDCIWFIVSFSPPILVFLLYVVREVGLYSIDVVSLSNYPIFLVTLGVENLFLWAIIWEVLCVSVLLVYRLHKLLHDNFNMYVILERQRIEGVELLMRSIEGERRRVAQELHDGSGVVLTALRMKLMQIIDEEDVRDCKKNLQKMLNDIDHLTVEIREISHFIMPISLSKLGLMAGIHELIDKLNLVNSTIDFQLFQFYEENRLTSDQQINIYRICQELLNNAIKHAKASQVVLNLVQDVDILSISMEDNGVGFDSGMIIKGMGMNNINLRVKLMLGTFQFESDSKKGSFFQIKLPFNKP